MISQLVIAFIGLATCIVWKIDAQYVPALGGVTMKFMTAISFLFLGAAGIALRKRWEVLSTMLYVATATLGLISLAGYAYELPFAEQDLISKTVAAGLPSVGTVVAFFGCGVLGGAAAVLHKRLHLWAYFPVVIGLVALVGHFLQVPLLYYYVPGYSTAMAVSTAGMFVLAGIGFIQWRPDVVRV